MKGNRGGNGNSSNSNSNISKCLNININIKDINKLAKNLKKKIVNDINILKTKKIFKQLGLSKVPILMGIVNLTPDSFSDGGNYNNKN